MPVHMNDKGSHERQRLVVYIHMHVYVCIQQLASYYNILYSG